MRQLIVHSATKAVGKNPVSAYVRVSGDKDPQLGSYHAQKDYYEKKFTDDSDEELVAVYGDEGKSGRTQRKRPDFKQMMIDAKLGKFKTIYTKSVSRFGRNSEETMQALIELRDYGVNVIFENEGLDTKNMGQELLVKMKAIFAEQESNANSQSVKQSYRRQFEKGVLNSQRSLYGYDVTKNPWEVNEEQADVVRAIFDLYFDGWGRLKIAKHLMEHGIVSYTGKVQWSTTTIGRMLRNEKYIGNMRLQKTYTKGTKQLINNGELPQYLVENTHPAIVDRETFDRVQEMCKERREKMEYISAPNEYELSGKVECGLCGKPFRRRINSKIKNFSQIGWICQTFNNCGLAVCRANQISDDLLKEIIVDVFNEYLDTEHETPAVSDAKKEIAELVSKENVLQDLLNKSLITYPQYNEQVQGLRDEYDRLDKVVESEQGNGLYRKQGKKQTKYIESLVLDHIDKIALRGYAITFTFKNGQQIKARYKYEHRRYVKDND